jgi:hypothetical protein
MFLMSEDLVYMPALDRVFNNHMLSKQNLAQRVTKIDSNIAALVARQAAIYAQI